MTASGAVAAGWYSEPASVIAGASASGGRIPCWGHRAGGRLGPGGPRRGAEWGVFTLSLLPAAKAPESRRSQDDPGDLNLKSSLGVSPADAGRVQRGCAAVVRCDARAMDNCALLGTASGKLLLVLDEALSAEFRHARCCHHRILRAVRKILKADECCRAVLLHATERGRLRALVRACVCE